MEDLLVNGSRYTPDQRRLLGGWRNILDDIGDLCTSLSMLPDGCACGNGVAHLGGSCVCCNAPHDNHIPICADCGTLLAQLRPRVDALTVDTARFFPVVTILLGRPQFVAVRSNGECIEHHIAVVMCSFDRLALAAGEFQHGCRASHLRVLKDHATALLSECQQLDERLEEAP